MRSFLTDMLNEIQSNLIEQLIGEQSFGKYLGDLIGGFLGGLFGLGHAAGGDVKVGMIYPVGEKGPELFMPR